MTVIPTTSTSRSSGTSEIPSSKSTTVCATSRGMSAASVVSVNGW
jgi:hypothetical protein